MQLFFFSFSETSLSGLTRHKLQFPSTPHLCSFVFLFHLSILTNVHSFLSAKDIPLYWRWFEEHDFSTMQQHFLFSLSGWTVPQLFYSTKKCISLHAHAHTHTHACTHTPYTHTEEQTRRETHQFGSQTSKIKSNSGLTALRCCTIGKINSTAVNSCLATFFLADVARSWEVHKNLSSSYLSFTKIYTDKLLPEQAWILSWSALVSWCV